MNRPSVCLAVIAKNEEKNMSQWFESVKGLFDQYVFVDTGSTDKTVEIAKEYGLEVHHFDWIKDFSAARNFAFSKAKTDYICWLDLDDVLENREGFILFRDTVMELADYWVSTYHYASDDQGNPRCSFLRERVIKNHLGMKWEYAIHEGIKPVRPDNGPVTVQFTQSWAVRHKRTAEDLEKDRNRNLGIFDVLKAQGKMDHRIEYYYGKELVEAKRPIEAIPVLLSCLSKSELEPHDRTLSFEYLIHAYMLCNQWDQAISMAFTALQFNPLRAEYYCFAADCYLKLNKPAEASVLFEAARKVPRANPNMQLVFSQAPMYGAYPTAQLARIYYTAQNIDKAEAYALELKNDYQDPNADQMLEEIRKNKSLLTSFTGSKDCDDIVITCPPSGAYLWDPEIAKTKAMGGSETAAIEMAYWLHKLSGRKVLVFNPRETELISDGVEYHSTSKLVDYMAKNKPYLHIAWRHNFKVTDAPTFLWCHDLFTQGGEYHQNYKRILALTPFHKRYLMERQGIPENKIHVTRNGIRPERFLGEKVKKDPWKFVFGSSPDRGLEAAIEVLSEVRVKYPELKLHVFYGIEHLDRYNHTALKNRLMESFAKNSAWVVYHGSTQQEELMRHYKEAAYNVQPSDWIETSCISAMELVLSGVFPIFREIGGVADTLREASERGMAKLIHGDYKNPGMKMKYVEAVMTAIETEAYKKVEMDPLPLSWENVAKEWLRDLPLLREKT